MTSKDYVLSRLSALSDDKIDRLADFIKDNFGEFEDDEDYIDYLESVPDMIEKILAGAGSPSKEGIM